MTRKLGTAGLALSVLFAIVSLIVKGGVGLSQAQIASYFNLTGAKAYITHETANFCPSTCVAAQDLSAQCLELNTTSGPVASNSTYISCSPEFASDAPYWHSDSYDVLAHFAAYGQQDLNQTILLGLAPGYCSNFPANFSNVPPGTWIGVVPGGSLYRTNANAYEFTYSFEGNIPGYAFLNETEYPYQGIPIFDRLELNLSGLSEQGTTTGSVSLEGNANLCEINGPMALAISLGNPEIGPSSFSCVNVQAPYFNSLDISSAWCPVLFDELPFPVFVM
jgi:hypothetical protein